VRPRPPRVVLVEEVGVVVWRKDRVLLVQRAEQGRWAEMWEFPHGPVKAGESHEQAAKRLLRLTGISAALGTELATIRHSVTRFRIKLVCLEARYRKGLMQSKHHEKAKWVSPRAVAGYPLSVPQRKIAELLAAPRRSP
jgi:A/G-specific adenine glycosylase